MNYRIIKIVTAIKIIKTGASH